MQYNSHSERHGWNEKGFGKNIKFMKAAIKYDLNFWHVINVLRTLLLDKTYLLHMFCLQIYCVGPLRPFFCLPYIYVGKKNLGTKQLLRNSSLGRKQD